MQTFADKVISFNKNLSYDGTLPAGIRIMNPFRENDQAMAISTCTLNTSGKAMEIKYTVYVSTVG